MWRNYLTVGVRALAKNRTYAFINILGLAIGMAACLMILLFVRYEMSYDSWIPGRRRTPTSSRPGTTIESPARTLFSCR
jgi:putative ABC transport system permease protein